MRSVDELKSISQLESIPVNIWDDYLEEDEDGSVPEGEKQETNIYIEADITELAEEKSKEYLEYLLNYMKENLNLDGVKMEMFFYVGRDKYPNLVGTEYENCLFDRWEIKVENLTHERRYKLVEELEEANLYVEGIPFEIYSES